MMLLPTPDQIREHLGDRECYDAALGIEVVWPHLRQDGGYFITPQGKPADHYWNRSPEGVIVDVTAAQFGVNQYIIRPEDKLYKNYLSYEHNPEEAMEAAHNAGHHRPSGDYLECCHLCRGL